MKPSDGTQIPLSRAMNAPLNHFPALATPESALDPQMLRRAALRVLEIEARAITGLNARIDEAFVAACECLYRCRGRVVVTGIGKSGHIARKIAATLASTGTPAFFVHPAEASHGDLGMITRNDVVLALSNSGETDELLTILPVVRRMGVCLIAMTGKADSRLSRLADVHLEVSVDQEACPLNLAPTASTTAALVMGDALAVALLEARGFTADDFAATHPAGQLGRRLLVRISDVMHSGAALPKVGPEATVSAALVEMTRTRLGLTAVVEADNRLLGVFTDGDLRRALDDDQIDLRSTRVERLMTRGGKRITADQLAIDAARMMEDHQISALLVVDAEERVVGALNFHDLLRARVV